MSSMRSDHDVPDIESQQIALLIDGDSPRDQWRWILVILRAHRILISRADRAKKASADTQGDADLEQTEIVEILPSSPHVLLEVHCDGTNDSTDDLEQTEIVEILPSSPQVLLEVHCDGTNDSTDVKLQHANIAQIVRAKDLGYLKRFGGIQGIAEALDTDLQKGIPGDDEDLCSRRIIHALSEAGAPARGFFKSLLKSCNSYIIFLLFVSAAMSIGFGIYEKGPQTGWYQGVIIIVAVIILVVVSSIRDFWHKKDSKLPEKQVPLRKRPMEVDVLRGGHWRKESISDVVNGDIVCLRRGYHVPGDGLFISGEDLKLDDSLSTIDEQNPFLSYGAKVINGHGLMLVTSVGRKTAWGEMMSQVTPSPGKIKLPAQLDKASMITQIIGLSVSILIPVLVFLHFQREKHHDSGVPEIKGKPTNMKDLMDIIKRIIMKPTGNFSILTNSLAMLVVGIMEGVPCIVTFSILYWNKKALSDKAFAQDSLACVSMGSVTTICTGKTGGLTLYPQEVVMCWIGEEVIGEDSVIDPVVLEALCNGISAPVLMTSNSTGDPLISWATPNLGLEVEVLKRSYSIINTKQLGSCEEGKGVLMKKKIEEESHMCLHWSGPAKTILTMCSVYYDSKGMVKSLDEHKRHAFQQKIEHMLSKKLKPVAFAFKLVYSPTFEDDSLILIGLIGLKHICPTETRKAAKGFKDAGVNIILISEEDVSELQAIALERGLLHNEERLVLEGEFFRGCTDDDRMHMVDNISVIGNSLPSDKLLLVRCLKQNGHMVAMVGGRTNEIPALKEANLGVAMGISWSSELAIESSDILFCEGDLNSLLSVFRYGRCAYYNIQKYIQYEVTVFVAWLLVTTIATAAFGDAPISGIQWFWVNLIVAFPGGFGLLTEPPSKELMEKTPVRQTDQFITKAIWRNIITQALFQTVNVVTFQFEKASIHMDMDKKVRETMAFNSLVLCQVFNLVNAREPNRKNVFKGIHQNLWFWVAVSVIMVLQVAFIEIAHILVGNAKLNAEQWGICVLIGMLSLLIDFAAKSISTLL